MAGNWLKFETDTPEKPEVFGITVSMGWTDPDLTVGKLMKVWRWFDSHTIEGNAPSVTLALLDSITGVTGFAKAMCDVGWLCLGDTGLSLPKFHRHNGKTAKDRALTAKRVADFKAKTPDNDEGNGVIVTYALPRIDKNRIDKNKTLTTNSKTNTPPDSDLFSDVAEQVVIDFKKLRKEKKASITKTAIEGIRREASKAGLTLEAALMICCERGWQGFKADWVSQARAGPNRQESRHSGFDKVDYSEGITDGRID